MSAQAVKPRTEINEMESLQLTRNLIRIAISEISYIRGLFPEEYFLDRHLPALEMKVKKLMPMDTESRRLIDWMEKGVYDALQKKYLETLFFRLCDGEDGPMIEEYAFFFQYDESSDRVSMDITRSNRHGRKGNLMNTNSADITPAQMKAAACKMIRTLVQLMRTLNNVPAQRTIIMQLYYKSDITPADYEPPFFRSCTYEDNKLWAKRPLILKVGNVNSKHCEVSLKVRSVLDPCEDEFDSCGKPDDKMDFSATTASAAPSTSHDSTFQDDRHRPSSKKPSPVSDEKLVSSATGEGDVQEACLTGNVESDVIDDMMQDRQLVFSFVTDVKEWVAVQQSSTFDEIDILANFPQISMALLEEVLSRLLKEGFVEKIDKDKYRVTKFEEHTLSYKNSCEEAGLREKYFPAKSKLTAPASAEILNATQDTACADDEKTRLYDKALKLVLPMKHVTARQLMDKLDENVSPTVVNQILQRMGKEGYIEVSPSSRRLGRRVLRHLPEAEYQLQEVCYFICRCPQMERSLEYLQMIRSEDQEILSSHQLSTIATAESGESQGLNFSESGLDKFSGRRIDEENDIVIYRIIYEQIVEGVKDVVIAAADDSSEEKCSSDGKKVELRTKMRADSVHISNCKETTCAEIRSEKDTDEVMSGLNAYELRTKKKGDSCVIRSSNSASEQHTSDNSTSYLKSTCVPSVVGIVDECNESKKPHSPTKTANTDLEDETSDHLLPDKSSAVGHARSPIATISLYEERAGPSVSSDGEKKSQETDTNSEMKCRKSDHRIRKASKVEEPIHQSLNSSTKRLRA